MKSLATILTGVFVFGSAGCVGGPALGVRESNTSVKLVGTLPRGVDWVFLGRVKGVAADEGFVEAAEHARDDLLGKAARLGATLVKIERIQIPAQGTPGASQTFMVGRAYRIASPAIARSQARKPRI